MSKVTVIGVSERDGEQIEWFGNNVSIQGVPCTLYRVEYMDGARGEFYAPSFAALFPAGMVGGVRVPGDVRSVRYCGA